MLNEFSLVFYLFRPISLSEVFNAASAGEGHDVSVSKLIIWLIILIVNKRVDAVFIFKINTYSVKNRESGVPIPDQV